MEASIAGDRDRGGLAGVHREALPELGPRAAPPRRTDLSVLDVPAELDGRLRRRRRRRGARTAVASRTARTRDPAVRRRDRCAPSGRSCWPGPGVVLEHAVDGLRALRRAGERRRAQHLGRQGRVRLAQPAPPRHRRPPGVGLRAGRPGRRRPDHHHRSRRARGARRLGAGAVGRRAAVVARGRWPSGSRRATREIAVPPLRADLAAVTQAGWERTERAAAADQGHAALQPGARRRGPGGRRSRHGRLLGRPHLRDAAARRRRR